MIKKIILWFENLRIRNKLIFTFTLVLFFVMVFIYAYFPYKQEESVYKEMDQRISTLANSVALGLAIFLYEESYNAWSEVIQWLDNDRSFAYILIFDEKKELIAVKPENFKRQNKQTLNYYEPTRGDDFIEIRVPIRYKKKYLGDIILGMELSGVKEAVFRINLVSTITLTGIFAVSFFLVLFISGIINKPVQLLLDSVNKIINSGHYNERVGHYSKDEIGTLSHRFHEMVEMIEQRDMELNRQYEELQKVIKLKDEFVAFTAHDLRSPLTAIAGFTDLLLMSDYLEEEDRNRLHHIESSADFLSNLVSDFLDIGHLKSGRTNFHFKTVSVNDVIRTSIKTIQYMALPKEITIHLENVFGRDRVMGNFDALLRIVNNLLSNAVKFTPDHGRVTVRTALGPLLENDTVNNALHISVTDTGIGIAVEKLPLLFETYSLHSRDGTAGERGTGLGLSITKTLVQKHNGRLLVSSQEGKGSCFTAVLPLAPDADDKPSFPNGKEDVFTQIN